MGGEDDTHDGGADAAHEGGWGFALDEGLGGDHDAGDRDADDEVAEDGGPEIGQHGEKDEAEGDAGQAGINEDGVGGALGEGAEGVHAEEHADADHGSDDGVNAGTGVKDVADIDGDERGEAADDEHGGGHGDDDEKHGGVMDDEGQTLLHVGQDGGEAGARGGCGLLGCGLGGRGGFDGGSVELGGDGGGLRGGGREGTAEGEGGEESGRADEGYGIGDVADLGTEKLVNGGGEAGTDDPHGKHDLLEQDVGGAEAVLGDGSADGDALGGRKEAGYDGDSAENEVEVPGRGGEQEQEAKAGAGEIGGDEGGFERPAIDKDAGEDAEDGDGEEIGDLKAGDLLGRGVEMEGEEVDDGEEGEEVAEDGDDLGVEEPAHDGDAQDGGEREWPGRGGRCFAGGGCGNGSGCAHAGEPMVADTRSEWGASGGAWHRHRR